MFIRHCQLKYVKSKLDSCSVRASVRSRQGTGRSTHAARASRTARSCLGRRARPAADRAQQRAGRARAAARDRRRHRRLIATGPPSSLAERAIDAARLMHLDVALELADARPARETRPATSPGPERPRRAGGRWPGPAPTQRPGAPSASSPRPSTATPRSGATSGRAMRCSASATRCICRTANSARPGAASSTR